MARKDWRPYYTPIWDRPIGAPPAVYYRQRSNARRAGEFVEAMTFGAVKLVGIAVVKGKDPYVQKWFKENHADRWDAP